MKYIFCFGELLLRLSPSPAGQWIGDQQVATFIGGAEANVATALAGWGQSVRYGTVMPDNYLAHDVAACLRQRGIDTSAIQYNGSRLGIYYMQQGADLKHGAVIYDRAYSSFSGLQPGMVDWDRVLEDVGWFHFTAITPALNERMPAVCLEALAAASSRGITISMDLNYRAKLWQYGKNPVAVMPALAGYCDVIMGNVWAANTLLGIPLDTAIETAHNRDRYLDHAQQTALAIQQLYPRCKVVANTFRFDQGDLGIHYYATLHRDGQVWYSPEFETTDIVDKAGSGDCFMAGLIHGLLQQQEPQHIIDFAAAAAVGKLMERGDATQQSIAAIHKIIAQYA